MFTSPLGHPNFTQQHEPQQQQQQQPLSHSNPYFSSLLSSPSLGPPGRSSPFQQATCYMSFQEGTTSTQPRQPHFSNVTPANINFAGKGMPSPTFVHSSSSSSSGPYIYPQEDQSASSLGMSSGSHHGQYQPMAPAPEPAPTMYSYAPPPPQYLLPTSQLYPPLSQSQHHQDQNLLAPALASAIATGWGGSSTVPRSISMGYFPGDRNGMLSPSTPWFNDNGHSTPFGVLTPGSTLPHSTATRLGIVVPSSTITNNLPHEHRTPEYNMYPSSAGGGAVSPSMPGAPSLFWNGGGSSSGPGTASKGGIVPLTPMTDHVAPFEYYHFTPATAWRPNYSFSHVGCLGNIGNAEMADQKEDIDKEDEEDRITPFPPCLGGPQGGVGVTRTQRKHRSTTIAAGPYAAATAIGNTRSYSGIRVNGGGVASAGLVPSNGLSEGSFTLSPVDINGSGSASMGLGMGMRMPVSSSSTSVSASPVNTSTSANRLVNPGQVNSLLAMKGHSPADLSAVESYLNRYLNYLCDHPDALNYKGHQIGQPLTARQQRDSNPNDCRPLQFRIGAFLDGFIYLLTAKGLSIEVTMKIPHYLSTSRLFSRLNEEGKSILVDRQAIWRARARCRNGIPCTEAPANGNFYHHSPSAFSPQQQQDNGTANGLLMVDGPLLWEFLLYEHSIIGQPRPALVGTTWQWNMKVRDHWKPRSQVRWSCSSTSSNTRNVLVHGGTNSSLLLSASVSSSSLPKWLSLQGSQLKGTPTEVGIYPIVVEAMFQDVDDPEPIVVRGKYVIQVSNVIKGWKPKVALLQGEASDSPKGDGNVRYGHESSVGGGIIGGSVGSGNRIDDIPASYRDCMSQLAGMHANQW